MPWDSSVPFPLSLEEAEQRNRDVKALQALAELGDLTVHRFSYGYIDGRMMVEVQDRNGRRGSVIPSNNRFKSTEKFAGPLAPFTTFCGDGIWGFSINL